jgi:hypothetical protein
VSGHLLRRRSIPALATLAAAVVGLCGCAKGPPMGEVSGRVTFEGKPVAEGRVTFMNSDVGAGGEGLVKDGAYSLSAPLPTGEYKVSVEPLIVRQRDGGKGPEVGVEKPAPDIPLKYRTTGSTDLRATVKEGRQDLNFDMKR